jgi:phosphoribosylformylglycinamidine cyclo-ligase
VRDEDLRPRYTKAGVDVGRGEEAVERIRPWAERTYTPQVLGTLGGFAGAFRLDLTGYEEPVLLAGADGVGTKLAIAEALGRWDTVGMDLVAMCVNDVAAQGGRPLFFLDYIAADRLSLKAVEEVVASMSQGCLEAGCALLGGEMAEMPGFYPPGRMDLAGFAVGVAERRQLWGPHAVRPGDVLVGLASEGLHANGYSLVRRILEDRGLGYGERGEGGRTLGEELLSPTRIYVKPLQAAGRAGRVHAAAHITGGGWQGNVPRMLPPGLCAHVDTDAWPRPSIFSRLAQWGEVPLREMFATFNMGVGMVLAVASEDTPAVLDALREAGQEAYRLGEVRPGERGIKLEGLGP